jgi:hypothetical protein
MAAPQAGPRCPRCGRPLPQGVLDGLCPVCLMRQAMGSEPASARADPAADNADAVVFTTSLSSLPWTLVTLMADDEEFVTYLAREPGKSGERERLGQLVVRKQHVPPLEMPAARQQLTRRLDALRRLSHPALAPVLDGGLTDEGHPFLVTAFVMATPLADIESEGASPEMVRELVERADAALRALHDAGLAHGRVRASTVLARRTRAGATTVVTGYAPLDRFPALSVSIADDLEQFQRLTSTLRI